MTATQPATAPQCVRPRASARPGARHVLRACVLLGFSMGLSVSSIAEEPAPQTFDGMHTVERTRALRALSAGNSAIGAPQSSAPRTRRLTTTPSIPTEPVLLLLERRRVKGASERLADAWYYSYDSNETTHKIIDLTAGSVRSTETVIDLQLPLIDAEISRAFDIVLGSSTDRRALELAYRQVTGTEFADRSQVSFKAFVFHPDTVADGLEAAARRCGVHRCAQMLLYTHDNVALDMSPIVDLSTGRVLQNLELRAQAIVRREEAAL